MLIQPTPIRSSARRSRAWRRLTFAAGPAVVVAVATIGFLGRDQADRSAVVPVSEDVASASAPDPTTAEPDLGSVLATNGMPSSALGLPVLSVPGALAQRAGADPGVRGLVAIGGYMTLTTVDPACATHAESEVTFCGRAGSLSARPTPAAAVPAADPASALRMTQMRVDLPLGVAAPSAVLGPTATLPSPTVLAIVFGRFHDEVAPCPWGSAGCDLSFRVDRVVWAAGRWLPIDPEVDPALTPSDLALGSAGLRLAVGHAVPGSGPLLGLAAMRPSTLERILPQVIPHLRGLRPVWVVWMMLRPDRQELPGLAGAWAVATSVIEDDTGQVVFTTLGS
jgi:hypothetical protein